MTTYQMKTDSILERKIHAAFSENDYNRLLDLLIINANNEQAFSAIFEAMEIVQGNLDRKYEQSTSPTIWERFQVWANQSIHSLRVAIWGWPPEPDFAAINHVYHHRSVYTTRGRWTSS